VRALDHPAPRQRSEAALPGELGATRTGSGNEELRQRAPFSRDQDSSVLEASIACTSRGRTAVPGRPRPVEASPSCAVATDRRRQH
jgi:hypothetical protein